MVKTSFGRFKSYMTSKLKEVHAPNMSMVIKDLANLKKAVKELTEYAIHVVQPLPPLMAWRYSNKSLLCYSVRPQCILYPSSLVCLIGIHSLHKNELDRSIRDVNLSIFLRFVNYFHHMFYTIFIQ